MDLGQSAGHEASVQHSPGTRIHARSCVTSPTFQTPHQNVILLPSADFESARASQSQGTFARISLRLFAVGTGCPPIP